MSTSRSLPGPGIGDGGRFRLRHASAAAGGNTIVLPFALQQRGTSLRACVEDYRRKAESECYVDTAFHLIVSDPTPEVLGQELPRCSRTATRRSRSS